MSAPSWPPEGWTEEQGRELQGRLVGEITSAPWAFLARLGAVIDAKALDALLRAVLVESAQQELAALEARKAEIAEVYPEIGAAAPVMGGGA